MSSHLVKMSATLILGNCLEKMRNLPDKSIDCFVCDLPYGQLNASPAKNKGKKRLEAAQWDKKIDLKEFWEQVERLAATPNTPILHFCNTKFGIDLINSKPDWFRYDLVWDKGRGVSFLLANKQPMRSHEMIYVFSRGQPFYNRIDEEKDNGKRCSLSVIPQAKTRAVHPTAKPVALYKWLLERYCPNGGTVLDPTAGSFSSIVVAKQLGLKGIGIEMTPSFFYDGVALFTKKDRYQVGPETV